MHSISTVDHLHALLHEAENRHRCGDLANAESIYRQILENHAADCNAHDLLTSSLLIRGRFEDAEIEIRNAAALTRILAETCNNLGLLLAAAGHVAKAETHYRQALSADPNFVEARCNLACLLHREKRVDEATEQIRAALDARPPSFDAQVAPVPARKNGADPERARLWQ